MPLQEQVGADVAPVTPTSQKRQCRDPASTSTGSSYTPGTDVVRLSDLEQMLEQMAAGIREDVQAQLLDVNTTLSSTVEKAVAVAASTRNGLLDAHIGVISPVRRADADQICGT